MSKYEYMSSLMSRLYEAMLRSNNEGIKNMWYLQYQKLEWKRDHMTIQEAKQLVC